MKKFQCLLGWLLLMGSAAMAQKVITGKVVDKSTNEPLLGVNVLVDKQKGGAVTKQDGTYSITLKENSVLLIFSYVGYNTQTITIGNRTTIDISLEPAPVSNDEVVVIGYGTQRKSHLTGAVSKFKNEKLDESPTSRLDNALQGKIAGVQIQNMSSEAGADPRIRVRGLNSINAVANPLIVVDGVPIPDGLSSINNADVESVEVLKDAASAAIYGSRAAGGVIMITTKSGKSEKAKYTVKFSTGSKTQYKTYPMMSTTEYTNLLFYEASLKAKDPSITPPTGTGIIANNERAAYIVESVIMQGQGTDWQREALRDATVRNIQMNVSGGNKFVRYFISGAYQRDQGMMYHSEYDKYSLRSRIDIQLSKRVKINFNLNPTYIKRERPSVNFIDFVRFQSFLPVYHNEATAAFVNQTAQWANIKPGDFAQARHFNGRVYSGLMPDGSTWVTASPTDPFNTANNTPKSVMETRTIKANDYRVLSSGDLTVNIIPGLDFKTLASAYVSYSSGLDFTKRSSSREGDVNRGIYTSRLTIDLLSENTFNYNKQINDHSLNVLAGFTAQKTRVTEEQTTGLDYPSDNITTLNTALQIDKANSFNNRNQIGLVSLLGRVIYSYKEKYLFNASFRRDGSSYFGPKRKWGSFPAVSVGWVISQEKFMDKVSWLSHLKLRGSYGLVGNNLIGNFAFVDLLFPANYPFGATTGTVNSGQVPSRDILSNPDITWERTYQFDGGLDITLFNNFATVSIDYYKSRTQQLLLRQATMGFAGVTQFWNNVGRLKNRGIELELTTNNIRKKDFRWTTMLNFAHNKNKIVSLGGDRFFQSQGERTELYRNEVDHQFIEFFGYKTDGVWLSQAQIDEARAGGLTSQLSNLFVPGGLKLVDVNGDKVINEDDRVVTGSPLPDFTWGINNSFTYKSFDISFLLQGVQGGELINGDPNYNETKRYNKNYNKNRWLSPMFPGDGKTPYSTVGFNWMLTDYVVEDASYYALREIIIGYTLPNKFTKRLGLSSMRFYFSGQNLYFHFADGYRGINPEARYTTTGAPYNTPIIDGYQRGSFPMPKTLLVGIDVNF